MIIERKKYLDKLIELQWNGKVKVINGVRLGGKSFLLFHIFKDYLLSHGVSDEHIIEKNLYCREIDEKGMSDLYKEIEGLTSDKNKKYYLFIDEIQSIKRPKYFLKWILELENVDVYVSGSDPYQVHIKADVDLVSDSVSIFVRPLSFSEFHSFKQRSSKKDWEEYRMFGGLPFVVEGDDPKGKMVRLESMRSVFYQCEYKDRRLRFSSYLIDDIVRIMFESMGKMICTAKITSLINKEYKRASYNRISNYLYNLCRQCLFEKCEVYDIMEKKRSWHKTKYYVTELGVRNSIYHFWNVDDRRITENIIFNELRYRGLDVNVGVIKIKDTEYSDRIYERYVIDFMAHDYHHSYNIKYVEHLDDKKKEKIFEMFDYIDNDGEKIVIVDDDVPEQTINGIRFVNIIDFLLKDDRVRTDNRLSDRYSGAFI